jgi:Leucine-rich repeat (LRR) protein
MSENALR